MSEVIKPSEMEKLRELIRAFCKASDKLRGFEKVASDLSLVNFLRENSDELTESYSELIAYYINNID